MKNNKTNKIKLEWNKKGKIAISQIAIMMIATFAFAWLVSLSLPVIEAGQTSTPPAALVPTAGQPAAAEAEGELIEDVWGEEIDFDNYVSDFEEKNRNPLAGTQATYYDSEGKIIDTYTYQPDGKWSSVQGGYEYDEIPAPPEGGSAKIRPSKIEMENPPRGDPQTTPDKTNSILDKTLKKETALSLPSGVSVAGFLAGTKYYKLRDKHYAEGPTGIIYELDEANKDWKNLGTKSGINLKDATEISGASAVGGDKKERFFGKLWGAVGITGLMQDAGWASTIYAGVKFGGNLIGLDKTTTDAASVALSTGFLAGRWVYKGIAAASGPGGIFTPANAPMWGFAAGIGTAILIYLMMNKKTSQEVITFQCIPWQAPLGGDNCEKCNQQGILPCNEYQCKSLGQGCVLENAGTGKEACVSKNKNDVRAPVVSLRKDALSEGYNYVPDKAILPPNQGTKIVNSKLNSGCIPPFTPVEFGIMTDEPARCKLDYVMKQNFSSMDFWFGGSSILEYNHTQTLSLPGPSATEAGDLTIKDTGEYQLFTRCQDANGNVNEGLFSFKFCVDKAPDTTPPAIVSTSIVSGMPIGFNMTSIDLDVFVNEPSNCKWSTRDQQYKDMENTMSCNKNVFAMNAQMLYKCSTTLTGLKNKQTNTYYFRCQDLAGNENRRSQPEDGFKLIGTQPFLIDSAGPNGTIRDSTDVIKVELTAETSQGYKDGEATCYFSDSGKSDSYVAFVDSSGKNKHKQELNLIAGSYTYHIKCLDLGGNADEKIINFNVESDSSPPLIVRAYKQENYLKIITSEDAICYYSVDSDLKCRYPTSDAVGLFVKNKDTEHLTGWDTRNVLYIKCIDGYGNEPSPDACSLVVKPSTFWIYQE